MRRAFLVLAGLAAVAGCSPAGAGCSVGQGTGDVYSRGLFAHECWGTPPPTPTGTAVGACYDLQPDFFAANPYRSTLQITVQRGSDIAEFSDGLTVLIDDVPTILAAIAAAQKDAGAADGGTTDAGTADGGVTDAGTDDGGATDAGMADGGAAGAGEYGLSDGGVIEPVSCEGSAPDAGPPIPTDPPSCDDIPPPVGKATFRVAVPVQVVPPGSPSGLPPELLANPPIVHMSLNLEHSCHNQNIVLQAVDGWASFNALFDGDPDETQAAAKLTDATFTWSSAT